MKVRIAVGLGATALSADSFAAVVRALRPLGFDSVWISEVLTGPGPFGVEQGQGVIEQLAAEADGRYRVGKVNVFEQQDLGVRYRITAIPTLLFF